ncbi:MAG: DUF2339 domain-containing protein, partial [Alcanivoracaceae bacterium]|nr:DUF2339 domain-containing protein [Alcanivoracaceae bacterium]
LSCLTYPSLQPLTYIPLLNPLDLWQIGILACAVYWWRAVSNDLHKTVSPAAGIWTLSGLSFIYLNTLLLRTLHATTDLPFRFEPMMRSDLVQTCLSIFWALLGVALLIAANKLLKRQIWIVGMSLIGVVVAKLFLVDLSNSGTVERIVSFIVVGLLLLGVGYLAPLPDKVRDDDSSETLTDQ